MRAAALALALLAGCGSGEAGPRRVRCASCGMIVSADSGWRAGTAAASFDSPKCLFRALRRGGDAEGAWVIEYYTQERRPARELLYVSGTDLEGPMGRDLVPVAGREAAERLRADHHGERVLTFDEVDGALVESLFR